MINLLTYPTHRAAGKTSLYRGADGNVHVTLTAFDANTGQPVVVSDDVVNAEQLLSMKVNLLTEATNIDLLIADSTVV